jgi:hypothetical protein
METNVYFDLVRPYCFTTVVSSLGWYHLRFEIHHNKSNLLDWLQLNL